MHPSESESPQILSSLIAKKITPLILTSRGYELVFPTLRELTKNYPGLIDKEKIFYLNCFVPYDSKDLSKFGFSKKESEAATLREARNSCYFENLILGSGNSKPLTLMAYNLMKKIKPKAVIFVDDKINHIEDFAKWTAHQKTSFVGLRYGHEDEKVKAFHAADKTTENNQLKKFLELKSELFK